jgi:MSHA pilin protein MshD
MSMTKPVFKQRGLSMIELMVFIVVVGVAVTGVLSVYSSTSRTSVDPMVRKQALAVAESLLEEVLSKPYTYCDPDDAQADTATSATIGPAGCATTTEAALGPEAGETRYSNTTPFDNVNDYNNFNMLAGINDLTNTAVPGLGAYTASVQVQAAGAFNGIPAGETLRVTVTVTGPGNHSISLSGYRTRYAPTL